MGNIQHKYQEEESEIKQRPLYSDFQREKQQEEEESEIKQRPLYPEFQREKQQEQESEIKRHHEEEEESEEEEEKESEGWTLTCEICTEPSKKMFNNNKNCSHPFCADCMIKYIQVKLEEHVPDIPCPAMNCNQFLDILRSKPLIPPQLFVKWCDGLFDSAVLKFDDRVYCPNRDCSELIVNECGGRGQITKVGCPKCKKLFCFCCVVPWHDGFECKEIHEHNDVALVVLADQEKWRRCPACRHLVERSCGCNTIHCRCGTRFCYSCGMKEMECLCKYKSIAGNIFFDFFLLLWTLLLIVCCIISLFFPKLFLDHALKEYEQSRT